MLHLKYLLLVSTTLLFSSVFAAIEGNVVILSASNVESTLSIIQENNGILSPESTSNRILATIPNKSCGDVIELIPEAQCAE